jgi:arylsulfatase A-like enzyme|eukprot:COSAG06_NODE_8704_length_2092_cov_1.925740_4_plen_179_part_00
MDVVDKPEPHEGYGFFLQDHVVSLANGTDTTGWEAHRACMNKGSPALCVNSTFTPELYEDDFTAANAIKLIKRAPADRPWFLHVSFPGPHDPFLVTTDMRNAASDGREWPQPKDDPQNGTPGGACDPVTTPNGTRTRCNYAAEIENLDRLFALVIAQVEESGYKDNTVICIASDHGTR